MKATHWILLALVASLGYTGYTKFLAAKALTIENPVITLIANGPQGTLEPLNSYRCPANASKGCVQFDEAAVGTITFTVQNGGKKDETCATQPQPNWIVTRVELTAAGDPLTGKGNFTNPPQPIPTWLTDAFPSLNAITGVAYDPGAGYATSSAVITNWNNNKKEEGVKTIYYKVTASHCDGTEPVVTDPMVRNGGR